MFEEVPIETVQAFWNERPCNIRRSPEQIGTRAYFDQVEQRKYFVEPHIPEFAQFERWRNKHVLEIGCGIGTDTINFARHGARVTAVDLSEKSLEIAHQRARVFGLHERIQFHQADVENLSRFLDPVPYDLVYTFGVIHHTPHPPRAIAQLKRFMDTRSELRMMVYSKISYKLFWIMKTTGIWDFGRLDEIISRYSEAQSECPVSYTYTFDEVRSLLAEFDVLDIKKAHIFTWDVAAYKQYRFQKDAAWEHVSDDLLAALEKELGWHTLVRARKQE